MISVMMLGEEIANKLPNWNDFFKPELVHFLSESISETSEANDALSHKEKRRQDTVQVKRSLGRSEI